MNPNDSFEHLRPTVIEIAEQAAEKILEIYDTDFDVKKKDDESPLTAADTSANDIIVGALGKLTPDIPILSEESATIEYSERAEWPLFWLVDPLDGTREFVKRNGEFTVNIALISGQQSILGVVSVPVTGVTYSACRGSGAFKQSADKPERRITVREYNEGLLHVAISRSHQNDKVKAFLKRLPPHDITELGSSLKGCVIAEGTLDLYARLGPTCEWDTGAMQCIIEEAGGRITDTDLKPLVYNKESLLNPEFLIFGKSDRCWTDFL